jgi:hypothetical protein
MFRKVLGVTALAALSASAGTALADPAMSQRSLAPNPTRHTDSLLQPTIDGGTSSIIGNVSLGGGTSQFGLHDVTTIKDLGAGTDGHHQSQPAASPTCPLDLAA